MEQWQSLADLPRKNSVSPSHRELTSGGGLKGTGQIRVTCSIFRAGFETPGINHDHWQHIRSQRILDVNCQETFLLLKSTAKIIWKKSRFRKKRNHGAWDHPQQYYAICIGYVNYWKRKSQFDQILCRDEGMQGAGMNCQGQLQRRRSIPMWRQLLRCYSESPKPKCRRLWKKLEPLTELRKAKLLTLLFHAMEPGLEGVSSRYMEWSLQVTCKMEKLFTSRWKVKSVLSVGQRTTWIQTLTSTSSGWRHMGPNAIILESHGGPSCCWHLGQVSRTAQFAVCGFCGW